MQGTENREYINWTNFDHYWSLLLELVRARERRVYWDQEQDPKQEGEDDCRCQCNLANKEEEEKEQTGCNHK